MTLVVTPLIGNGRFRVRGTDSEGTQGETILVSPRWATVLAHRAHKIDTQEFNDLVSTTFAPFTELAERRAARKAALTGRDWSTVVIDEGVEGKESKELELDEHGILLRILNETDGSSLVWTNGQLEAIR